MRQQLRPEAFLLTCKNHSPTTSTRQLIVLLMLYISLKCQFVNNSELFFAIRQKMLRKAVGNQIRHSRLDVHQLKMQSAVVEMF